MDNLVKQNWTAKDLEELDKLLKSYAEPEFQKFTAKIVNSPSTVLGVRTPVLRSIVKMIAKGNMLSFLDNLTVDCFEKAMIFGLLVTMIKDEATAFNYFNKYLPLIDSWALVDSVCMYFCLIGKNPRKHWDFVKALAENKSVWAARCGIVLMLKFYRADEFRGKVFEVLDGINSQEYYLNMVQAWLVSVFFIDNPEKTLEYLKSNKLNDFTHNKSIQKIKESFRVSVQDKEAANALKRERKLI